MQTSDFDYHLPQHLIAQYPPSKRGDSRLLVLPPNAAPLDCQFADFASHLRRGDLLVFNDTKVIPARLFGNKASGGKVEVLLEQIIDDHSATAQVRASKSPPIGSWLHFADHKCLVKGRVQNLFQLQFDGATVRQVIEKIGQIPLPPYITRTAKPQDLARYQTIFAANEGAVAAPTAGLHFDQELLAKLGKVGIAHSFVTLHIGAGTYRPVRVQNLSQHTMHAENYQIPASTAQAIHNTKTAGGRIIAVGSTCVRTLESAYHHGALSVGSGSTNIFITPGYQFQVIDAMLTNFHLPKSTLLMLVAAFAGWQNVMSAYRHAVANEYRFFSYGDAMFIPKSHG